jgi:polyisoprenoid-binding protein YceI
MRRLLLAAASLAIALAPTFAFAGRAPNADERAAIETALKAAGYVTWEGIEYDDDGYWEVDDARKSDGREIDLHVDPATLAISED